MPNIEIHGLHETVAADLEKKIRNLLWGASYEDDVVITVVPDRVHNLKGIPQPFLRIVATNADGPSVFAKIENRLKGLTMDIEEMVIHGFIPKPK